MEIFSRFIKLIGEEDFKKLQDKKICLIGVGGVGGMVAYSLVRSGIKNLLIMDHDCVSESNLNRQIVANQKTIGKKKVEVLKDILLDINPDINIIARCEFFTKDTDLDLKEFDYVIDCIDSVPSKLDLIELCIKNKVKIISSMGAGNRLDPTKIEIIDLSKTHDDPLSKTIRKQLGLRGIKHLDVCFSTEIPKKTNIIIERKNNPASSCFVPNAFGLCIGSYVIRKLLEE